MTELERRKIMSLQRQGFGYKKIAAELTLPVNSVKSFCRRHPIVEQSSDEANCLCCGIAVEQHPGRKQKKFCSDLCRQLWWKDHPEKVQRSEKHAYTCPQCGANFTSKNYGRVYCSRGCFAQARRKEVA